jgi:hypothetical protein
MKKTRTEKKHFSSEAIAHLADDGKDVSRFFTNSGKMMKPIQRVNLDFTASMLEELEAAAKELNISRQAVIKTALHQALDQRQSARASRRRQPAGIARRRRAISIDTSTLVWFN